MVLMCYEALQAALKGDVNGIPLSLRASSVL